MLPTKTEGAVSHLYSGIGSQRPLLCLGSSFLDNFVSVADVGWFYFIKNKGIERIYLKEIMFNYEYRL